MFGNPVLFQRVGINWTLVKCFTVAGGVLLVAGAAIFMIVVRHLKARSYRLTSQEVGRMMMGYAASTDWTSAAPIKVWGAKGVGIKVDFNIDSLRNAAKSRDWLTFFLMPAMVLAWFVGVWLIVEAALTAVGKIPFSIHLIMTVVVGLAVGIVLFMPWAALYTKIDLGAASEASGTDNIG